MRQAWGRTPALSSPDRPWLGCNAHEVGSCRQASGLSWLLGSAGGSQRSTLVDTVGKRGKQGQRPGPSPREEGVLAYCCATNCPKM